MYKVLLYHHRDDFETDFPTEADRTLYSDTLPSNEATILTGTGKNSITELPTFDFTILPNHPLYNEIVKFKTWITVYRGTNILFHGRVISDGLDFYGQKTVSCEGALGCLLDSVISPMAAVTETPKAHLQRIIAAHNALMTKTPYPEPYKCFTVGNVTVNAANANKKFEKAEGYSQTRSLIDDHLIDDYKGYLFARYESGTLYLDWLKEFNRVNDQPVKMAVNMLDRTIEESADEYYTVLLPVGQRNVTIDGTYLQDDAGIQKYGRIYKAESFGDSKKKADLLAKAQKEFAKRGTNLPMSVHIKAVDMSLLGGSVDELLAGDRLTNVEDRTGALFTDLTIAEHNYDIFNPANDEFIVENQEAIDKRHTSSGNGTISSRAGGGSRELFADTRDLYRNYRNLTLDVDDTYQLNANTINEASKYHNIITNVFEMLADESNVRTETDNITSVKFKNFYINHAYGYGDYVRRNNKTYMFTGMYTPGTGWEAAVEAGIVTETDLDESVDIKSIYGTHTHQDETGTATVIQDVTGIQMTKTKPTITDFSAETEYKEGNYVRYKEKIYRCLVDCKGKFSLYNFGYVAEKEDEGNLWTYTPVYRTDELGNPVMNLITGEKEYQVVDGNLDGIPVTNPIKSITRRTQTEFYDVIGTTDTYQSVTDVFSPTVSYAEGKGVKYNGKFYRFTQVHQGPWDWDHVEPLTNTTVVNGVQLYTMTSVNGSTLFHNEKEIDQIVGEIDVVQTKDSSGKVVGKDIVIKNGSGIRSQKDGTEVGIFENGVLNAGLMVNSLNSKSTDIVAIAFSTSKQYSVGDYVSYNGTVYRCTTAHKGAWNADHFAVASGKIAKLKADIVDLGEYATVGELNAKTIRAESLFSITADHDDVYAGKINVEDLRFDQLYGNVDSAIVTSLLVSSDIQLGGPEQSVSLSGAIVSVAEDPNPPSGKIGFTYTTAGGSTGTVNFNIADTQTYKDGVSAALRNVTMTDAGWRYFDDQDHQGYYSMVSNSANSKKVYVGLPAITLEASANWSSSHKKTVYAYGPGKYGTVATPLVIDASDIYQEGGIASSALSGSSDSASDYSTWTEDADKTLVLSKKYGLVTVSPNSGSNYDIVIDAARTYNAGWDALVSNASSDNYISLGSSSSATGSITKTTSGVNGYVWAKDSSGTWQRRRSFSISHTTGVAYHKSSVYSGSISVKVYLGNGYKTISSSAMADSAWNNL